MTDYKHLCAELYAAFNTYAVDMAHHDLLERARAALAEPDAARFRPASLSPGALEQWDMAEAAINAAMARVRTLAAPARAARPKPPSLKEQALLAIDVAVADGRLSPDVSNVVRRALEQLDG